MTNIYVEEGKRQDPTCVDDFESVRCRDKERGPMPWTGEPPTAGFSGDHEPWLPVWPDYASRSAKAQAMDESSTLSLYRGLLKVRRASRALNSGAIGFLVVSGRPGDDVEREASVLAYERHDRGVAGGGVGEGDVFLTLINFHCNRTFVITGVSDPSASGSSSYNYLGPARPDSLGDPAPPRLEIVIDSLCMGTGGCVVCVHVVRGVVCARARPLPAAPVRCSCWQPAVRRTVPWDFCRVRRLPFAVCQFVCRWASRSAPLGPPQPGTGGGAL